MEADYLVEQKNDLLYFRYRVVLAKDMSRKYVISQESLSMRKATSKSDEMKMIFEVTAGKWTFFVKKKKRIPFLLLS